MNDIINAAQVSGPIPGLSVDPPPEPPPAPVDEPTSSPPSSFDALVVPPKDPVVTTAPSHSNPPSPQKRKTPVGAILASLLLLLITLPLATYYISRNQQDIRSRAAETGTCSESSAYNNSDCMDIAEGECVMYRTKSNCENVAGKNTSNTTVHCCKWTATAAIPPADPVIPPVVSLEAPVTTTTPAYDCFSCVAAKSDDKECDILCGVSLGNNSYKDCCGKDQSASSINTCAGDVDESHCWTNIRVCTPLYGNVRTGDTCPATNTLPTVTAAPTLPNGATGCSSIKNYTTSMSEMACNHYSGSQVTTQGTFKGMCAFYHCPNGCNSTNECGEGAPGFWLEFAPCNSGKLGPTECGQIDAVDTTKSYCAPIGGCDALIQCGPTCQKGITGTQAPEYPQCKNIKIYKNDAVVTDYSSLQPGDVITIAVSGTLSSKARARVNGSTFTETTTKNTLGEYIIESITLPIDVESIVIEAQTFGTDSAWH